MADFENQHGFSLRCLSKDIIPVSVRLKSNIKTPKGRYILRKAERALLNERVRSINNSLTMFKIQWDTCINTLEKALDRETLNICHEFIKVRRERRHFNTLDWQLSKFHRLCQKNNTGHSRLEHGEHGGHGHTSTKSYQKKRNNSMNIDSDTDKNREDSKRKEDEDKEESKKNWVGNISKTPFTQVQEKLLSHGPNFVIVPKEPPTPEYIVAIEKACLIVTNREGRRIEGKG